MERFINLIKIKIMLHFRVLYWRLNYRSDNLETFSPRKYPAEYYWNYVNDFLKESSVCSVLEMGCSNGRDIIAWAKDFPDISFHGIDIQESAIAYARIFSLGIPNVTFDVANAKFYNCYDLYLACAVFIYLNDKELRNLFGKLKNKKFSLIFCEITAKDKPCSSHIYIHDYKSIIADIFPNAVYSSSPFAYGPWESEHGHGVLHHLVYTI